MGSDLSTNEQKQRYISALLEERRGHVTYGRTDQVEQVDAELARMGHEAETPHQRSTKMKRKPPEAKHAGAAHAKKDDGGGE